LTALPRARKPVTRTSELHLNSASNITPYLRCATPVFRRRRDTSEVHEFAISPNFVAQPNCTSIEAVIIGSERERSTTMNESSPFSKGTSVPIDLSIVSAGDNEPLIHPRDVYDAITRRPWPFLRQEQGEVLEGWFLDRDKKDIVIKQNTGGGKTAVGLLIAKSSLNEGVGPALYLVPNTYLIDQVVAEAARLEIPTVLEPTDRDFIAGNAVMVGTLQKLVNGRSRFGVDGASDESVRVGTIVIDDAHAALASVESQFALKIPSDHDFYDKLLAIFKEDLREQSPALLREIEEGSYTALSRVPFWAWRSKQNEVLDAIGPHVGEKRFKYTWPLIKDQLALCGVIFTGNELDIRPPAPPIHKIPSFVNATRRVYMTATLADDAVLTQDLGVDPAFIDLAITPKRASDIGNRVILAPLEIDSSLDPEAIRIFARKYADGWPDRTGTPSRPPINVVVLVPSGKAADRWEEYADAVWDVDDLKIGVPKLRAGHVGLVVLANKYDGIDLPGDACRLLIVDGLPSAMDAVERREASAMMKSPKVLARQVQRVEQGMGRGVRDSTDYCAVLLLGPALTRVIHDPNQRSLFSPATLKQLDLSRSLSTQLTGLDSVEEAIDLCLNQDAGWLKRDREALAGTSYRSKANIRPSVVAGRNAFDKAVAHNWGAAEGILRVAAEVAQDPAEKGWLLEQQAVYRDVTDQSGAQGVLLNAISYNHHVLHPIAAASLPKVRAAAVQAEAVARFMGDNFTDALDANLGIRELFDELIWEKEYSQQAEAVWEKIGRVLGFGSERPEVRSGTGPDNLWALNNGTDVVFELKTGALSQPIKKADVDQFAGHVRWFVEEYGVEPIPVIVHKSAEFDRLGTMPVGARVMTEANVAALREALLSLTAALPKNRWGDLSYIAAELATRNLSVQTLIRAYSQKPAASSHHL
jgi:hypothetical protein